MGIFYRGRPCRKKEEAGPAPCLFRNADLLRYFFLQSLWSLFFASLQSTFAASFFSAANTGATDTTENIAANAIASSFFMFPPLVV
jgi:hypothetical protein